MLFANIRPFVRNALLAHMEADNKQDACIALRVSDCRLFYILTSGGSMLIEGVRYPLTAGTAILFQAGTRYTWQMDGGSSVQFISVNFDYTHRHSHIKKSFHPAHAAVFCEEDILERLEFRDATALNRPLVATDVPLFEQRVRLLLTEFALGGVFGDDLLSSLLTSLVASLLRAVTPAAGALRRHLSREVVAYIQNRYAEPLTNESIAAHFHLHPVYLNRIFKRDTGHSLHAFLLDYRMSVAMLYLASEELPIARVGELTGYEDAARFSKAFKAHTGKTPREFRAASSRLP